MVHDKHVTHKEGQPPPQSKFIFKWGSDFRNLRRARNCIKIKYNLLHPNVDKQAKKTLKEFMVVIYKQNELSNCLKNFTRRMQFMSSCLHRKTEVAKGKLVQLALIFEKELQNMVSDCNAKKDKASKDLLVKLKEIDKQLFYFAIKKYFDRCKQLHTLVSCQWRDKHGFGAQNMLKKAFRDQKKLWIDALQYNQSHYGQPKSDDIPSVLHGQLLEDTLKFVKLDEENCAVHDEEVEKTPEEKLKLKKDMFLIKFWQIGMYRESCITSFEQLGFTDPSVEFQKKAFPTTAKYLEDMNFNESLYPEQFISNGKDHPPMIFLPDNEMVQKLIKTICKCKTANELSEKCSFN